MSTGQSHPLAALFAALIGSDAEFIQITPREGQSLEDAVAEHEAEHRKTCSDCAAEYEAAQTVKKAAGAMQGETDGAAPAPRTGVAAIVVGRVNGTSDKFVVQVPSGSELSMNTDLFTAQPAPDRKPMGFMAFTTRNGATRAIPNSFETDESTAYKKAALFNEMTMPDKLRKLCAALDVELPSVTIRPVFAD